MSHSNAIVAPLVSDNLGLLQELNMTEGVLDLACGNGRNGLFLLQHHIPVTFADNNESALGEVEQKLEACTTKAQIWQVDLEVPGQDPLAGKQFDAILVFNYLHRPLMNSIQNAVRPGGLVMYETFTVDQAKHGRPSNPDFLLKPGELLDSFAAWEILSYNEGERSNPVSAKASLVARKAEAQ